MNINTILGYTNKNIFGRWLLTLVQAVFLYWICVYPQNWQNQLIVLAVQTIISFNVYLKLLKSNFILKNKLDTIQCSNPLNDFYEFETTKILYQKTNPFVNTSTYITSKFEMIRISFAFSTISPYRIVGLVLWFTLQWLLSISVLFLGSYKNYTKYAHILMLFFVRCGLFCIGFFWIDVKSKPKKLAPIIVVNHTTFLDIFCLLTQHAVSGVGAKEYAHLLLRGFVKMFDVVLIDRRDPDSRKTTITKIKSRVDLILKNKEKDNNYLPLVIFPEATCVNGQNLINFKQGAFTAECDIQPIILEYQQSCNLMYHPAWLPVGPSLMINVLRLLAEPVNITSLKYLPTYHPSIVEKQDPVLFAKNVQKYMCDNSNLKAADFSYDDVRIMFHVMKINDISFCPNTTIVSFSQLKKLFSWITVEWITEQITKLYLAERNQNNEISIHAWHDLHIGQNANNAAFLWNHLAKGTDDVFSMKYVEFIITQCLIRDDSIKMSQNSIKKSF